VPAVVSGPTIFNFNPFVTGTLSETGNTLTATYSLTPQAPTGYSTPVGLAVYSILNNMGQGQVRILNVQGAYPLSAAHPTETIIVTLPPPSGLTAGEDDMSCEQVDTYFGGPSVPALILQTPPQNNDILNAHLLAALIDCSPQSGNYVGLTPGYYKNHTAAITNLGLSLSTTLSDLFGSSTFSGPYAGLANDTLVDALNFGGGPSLSDKAQILLRQAVAAYLNASYGGYTLSAAQVVADVQSALASQDPNVITNLANQLDSFNSLEGLVLNFPNSH
jgi:hypothetical protein